MANKWDDFHENMGDEQAALHMSGAFDSEVGHDHDSTLPGRGAPIKSTVDQTLAGGANTGTNNQILSWIVRQIKAITGLTNWYDTITKSFKDIFESDGTTVKKATHAGSADSAVSAESCTGNSATATNADKLGNISASSYMRSANSGTYIDADVYPGISLVGILIDKSTQALTGIKRSTYQTSYTVPSGKILFYVKGFFLD